jgi:nicotinamidase-related amidase
MVDYDPSTALVVVDVQNDFADPKGSRQRSHA